jgi:hypothetical protein
VRGGAKLRTSIYHAKEAREIVGLVDEFFVEPEAEGADDGVSLPPVFESCDNLIEA